MSTAESRLGLNHVNRLQRLGDVAAMDAAGMTLLFAAAFFNLVSLNADKDTIALDSQVLLKLAIVAASGLYGALSFASDFRVRQASQCFPAAWIPVIFLLYAFSSLFSSEPVNALVSSFSIPCIYLMTVACLVRLGKDAVLNTVFFASGLFVAGSWLIYFFRPEIGIMQEPVSDGEFATRMSGLAHPNVLGQFSAICVILGSVLYISYRRRGPMRLMLIGLALGALLYSMSRSSTVALFAALMIGYRNPLAGLIPARRMFIAAGFSVLVLMVASTQVDFGHLIQSQVLSLSKSGDTEEITSATGRGEIWAKTIELIRDRPAIGYGPASSKTLLADYSLYAHNMLLNIALSSGILGGLAGLMMCAGRIGLLFSHRHPMADALVVFVLVNGLFENVIFSNLCGLPTMVWTIGLVWFNIGSDDEREGM